MSVETLLECVTPTVGEGPHWDDPSQSLLFIDIIGNGGIYRWDSKTGKLEKHNFGKIFLADKAIRYFAGVRNFYLAVVV